MMSIIVGKGRGTKDAPAIRGPATIPLSCRTTEQQNGREPSHVRSNGLLRGTSGPEWDLRLQAEHTHSCCTCIVRTYVSHTSALILRLLWLSEQGCPTTRSVDAIISLRQSDCGTWVGMVSVVMGPDGRRCAEGTQLPGHSAALRTLNGDR